MKTIMNLTPSSAPLREVLYEFSLSKRVPNAELLNDFVHRFPQYADRLTEFAIELAMDTLQPEPDAKTAIDTSTMSPAVSRAISRFHRRLKERPQLCQQ